MQGLYYLASMIAIGLLMLWFIKNDKLKLGEPTVGLFRMDEPRPNGEDLATRLSQGNAPRYREIARPRPR